VSQTIRAVPEGEGQATCPREAVSHPAGPQLRGCN